eukprot:108884_1
MSEKKAMVVKQYESKCISTYDPTQSNPTVFWKIDDVVPSSSTQFCGHNLFPLPHIFIDHILWILHPKSFHSHIEQHLTNLFALFMAGICTNCITMREPHIMSPHSRAAVGGMLYVHIFCHPKIHRIVSKTCKLNKNTFLAGKIQSEFNKTNGIEGYVHDFDFICDIILAETVLILPEDADSIRTQNFYGQMMCYLRTLYLSIKYWKKYQVLFFVKYYLSELESALGRLHAILIANQHIKHLWDINTLIRYSIIYIGQKAKKLRC